MKSLAILLLFPIYCQAQIGPIKFSDLVAPLAELPLSVDKNDRDWKKNAKILISEINSKADFDRILVKSSGAGKTINGFFSNKDAMFDLSNSIENEGETVFKLSVSGALLRDIKVSVTEANSESEDEETPGADTYIGALTNANFVGKNKFLSNLTPAVNLGTVVSMWSNKKLAWELDVNPYIGGEIDTKTPDSFVPALMLYGRAGLGLNNYLKIGGEKFQTIIMPFNLGLKLIPNLKEDENVIIQHNVRPGIAFKIADAVLLSGQTTFAWHGLTSQSRDTFTRVIGNKATFMSYLTVIGQFSFQRENGIGTNYFFAEWRTLLSKKRYSDYTNVAILTVGIRKTLELKGNSVAPVSARRGASKVARYRKVIHMGL